MLVPTVHRSSELEQEPVPKETHPLQLSPQGQQPAGRSAACRKGARGDAGPRAKTVQCLGRGAGDGAIRLAPRSLEEDEHEQDADAESYETKRPVAKREEHDSERQRRSAENKNERGRRDAVVTRLGACVLHRDYPGLVRGQLHHLRLAGRGRMTALWAVATRLRQLRAAVRAASHARSRGRREHAGLGGATPQRADELAVVLVRDLAGAVVELELLQRGERAIALLGERQPPLFQLVRPGERVVLRLRARAGKARATKHDEATASTAPTTSAAVMRAGGARVPRGETALSTASGHSAISAPRDEHEAGDPERLTSGF